MKKINLLGATGSIGSQTLAVIQAHPDRFELVACSAGKNISKICDIISEFSPKLVSVSHYEDAKMLKSKFPNVDFLSGDEGILEVAKFNSGDILVNAVVGSIGLKPTMSAIWAKKTIALANKETLVTAGSLVMGAAKEAGVSIIPIDSEHSAIFQCLQGEEKKAIEKLILTASGGSFRDYTRKDLKDVTVKSALKHPNWSMGAKITIDSATMMNKGLEVIEAHWLFDVPYEQIDVLMHYESIIHSMVAFFDSSVLAQLGLPDMQVAISYALGFPKRLPMSNLERLNLAKIGQLNFKEVDFKRFLCLKFAYEAGKIGGTMPAVLNAANEAAVQLFLEEKISFLDIEKVIENSLSSHEVIINPSLTDILSIDLEVREKIAKEML